MPAYVIATMEVHDPDTYRQYTDRTPATVKRHGGRFLSRGNPVTTLEGEPFTERMVILEFPDRAAVDAWHADPDYVAAAAFRHRAATSRVLVQEAAGGAEAPDPRL